MSHSELKRLGTILHPLKTSTLETLGDNAHIALSMPISFNIIQDTNRDTFKDAIINMLLTDTSRWSLTDIEYVPTHLINDKVNNNISLLFDISMTLHDAQPPKAAQINNHKYLLISHEEGIISPDCKTQLFDSIEEAAFVAKCEILQAYINEDEITITIKPKLEKENLMPAYDKHGNIIFDIQVDLGNLATNPGDGYYDFPSPENDWHGFKDGGTNAEWQIFKI